MVEIKYFKKVLLQELNELRNVIENKLLNYFDINDIEKLSENELNEFKTDLLLSITINHANNKFIENISQSEEFSTEEKEFLKNFLKSFTPLITNIQLITCELVREEVITNAIQYLDKLRDLNQDEIISKIFENVLKKLPEKVKELEKILLKK